MKPRAAWALALLLSLPAIARADTSPPRIAHTPIARAPLGAAILVSCEITDDSAIFAPSLLVRPKGAKEFDTLELKSAGGDKWSALSTDLTEKLGKLGTSISEMMSKLK